MKALKQGELFIDEPNKASYVYLDGNLVLIGTIGAPAGTQIDGIDAEDLAAGLGDFRKQNNQNRTPIVNPDWTVNQWQQSDTTNKGNGSASTVIKWNWPHNAEPARDIDGFLIQVIESKTADTPVFKATTDIHFKYAAAVAYDPSRTAFSYDHQTAMNMFLAVMVIPYRTVSSVNGSNPEVLYGEGKIINQFQAYGYIDYSGVNINNIDAFVKAAADDSVLTPYDKQHFIIPNYYNRITGTNSDYAVTLSKLDNAVGFSAETKTNLRTPLTNSKAALDALFAATFPVCDPADLTKTVGNPTTLLTGDNWKLTHKLTNPTSFRATLTAFDDAMGAIDLSLSLLTAPSASAVSKEIIDEIADRVITAPEKAQFKSTLQEIFEPNAKDLKLFLVIKKVADYATKIADINTKLSAVQTALKVTDRLSYNKVDGLYTGTPRPILYDLTNRSKFASDAEVAAFYATWDAWNATTDTYNGLVGDQISAFKAAKAAWSHTSDTAIEFYHLFNGFATSSELMKALLQLKADINRTWTQIKAQLVANSVDETVTTSLAAFNTVLNATRTIIHLETYVESTGSLASLGVDETRAVVFTTPAEAEAVYNAAVNLGEAYKLAHYEFTVLTTDGMQQVNAMADDGIITTKEKIKFNDLLSKSKAEHAQLLADLARYPTIVSNYEAKYQAFLTGMEVTRYQSVSTRLKNQSYYRPLLGSSLARYSAITGGTPTTGSLTCDKEYSRVDESSFTLMVGEFLYERNTLIAAVKAEQAKVHDEFVESHKQDTSTIVAPSSLAIVFGDDPDKDGDYTTTASWAWAGTTDTIDGFIHLLKVTNKTELVTYTPAQLFANKNRIMSDDQTLSHEYELKAKKFVNLFVCAYRVVDKATYTAALTPKFQDKKKKTYFLTSSVARFTNSGTLSQVKENYTPTGTPAATPPNNPKLMDYWFNKSGSTQQGILSYTWGQWDGVKYVQISDEAAIKRLPADPNPEFIVQSTTEPPNKPGFYWENTSGKTVSGVPANVKAKFDKLHGIWVWNNSFQHFTCTTNPVAEGKIAYEGALCLNTVNYKIYRARNGKWSTFVDLAADEVGTTAPTIGSTKKRWYDKIAFKYYTRTATNKQWVERDLLLKSPLKTTTVPLPATQVN